MTSAKSFGILIGAKGEGARKARISPESPKSRVIAEIGESKSFTTDSTDQEGLGSTKPTPIEVEALKSTPIWDALG
jgi:hypothetical protein